MVKAETTTIYKTSDGREFKELYLANQYECALIVRKYLEQPDNYSKIRAMNLSGCQAEQISHFLAEHFQRLLTKFQNEQVF